MIHKKILLVSLLFGMLTACNQQVGPLPEYTPEEITYYAYFMNNYPRVTDVAPSGNEIRTENTLFKRIEIEPGVPFAKPDEDPSRNNYDFQGWFKEKSCENAWNFEEDSANTSIYLFAKWGSLGGDEWMEPEYTYPEKIITDADFRLTGIFNTPIEAGEVGLTTGMINRLTQNKDDVRFAVAYERRESVTFTATYNPNDAIIHIEDSASGVYDVKVNDISDELVLNGYTNYEDKAQKYETVGTTYENYHIALAGSSSMENWSTSSLDMMPMITFNHGIGGTTVEQWEEKLFQRLVLPYLPKAVVYYVGVNNIINGNKESGDVTGARLEKLFNKTHEYLPNTKIFYVLINKLPGYKDRQSDFDAANTIAINYAASHDYVTCIDAGKGLLKEDGLPNAAYFLSDGLHMSAYGYVIWGAAVKEAVKNWLDK